MSFQFDSGGGGSSSSTPAAYPLTITGTAATGTNNVVTATDTASNTGTGYAFNGTTAGSSALNGLKLNRGAAGTGSRALSVQDASVEKAWIDFSGNSSFASMAFGSLVMNGATSGTTTLQATAIAGSTTLTLPAATDTLIGKATTDTLTNKTYNTAGTGNTFQINGTSVTAVTGTGATAVLGAGPTISGTLVASGTLDVTGGLITATSTTLAVRSNGGNLQLTTVGGSGDVLLQPSGHVIADSAQQVTAPTIAGGTCGTSPSVSTGSTDNALEIVVGTGGTATSCQVNFGRAFTKTSITHPICVANSETDIFAFKVTYATGASVTITSTTAFTASSKISVICL